MRSMDIGIARRRPAIPTAPAPAWPLYDAQNDTALFLDETQLSSNGVRTTQCDFWDQALHP